jgi:hypothetical protein
MKRWAVFWACLSVVPISFDAYPDSAERSGPSDDQPEFIAPSALPVDSTP